jgi:hypothetical protein
LFGVLMSQFLAGAILPLSRRLEEAHARSGLASRPTSAIPIMGGWAIFDGPKSPMTQALAIGLEPWQAEAIDRLEEFFWDQQSEAVIDVALVDDYSFLAELIQRGYQLREVSQVLALRLDDWPESRVGDVECRLAREEERQEWTSLVYQAFSGEPAPSVQNESPNLAPSAVDCWFGLQEGEKLAAAAALEVEGIYTHFGDATLLSARGRGLQSNLIRARMEHALRADCDWAAAAVIAGTSSQRNYLRAGFAILYSRHLMAREKR